MLSPSISSDNRSGPSSYQYLQPQQQQQLYMLDTICDNSVDPTKHFYHARHRDKRRHLLKRPSHTTKTNAPPPPLPAISFHNNAINAKKICLQAADFKELPSHQQFSCCQIRLNHEAKGEVNADTPMAETKMSCNKIMRFNQDSPFDKQLKPESLNRQQHQQQQQCANDIRHLVRTVSDLPVFVTIEGYRVASYSIAGEPHLCLPQLLQYIKQKFPLEKVIDTFEETITYFTSASPKQVEGFVKASVLPPNAESCPLIKRSDADRVCLQLFDQCFRGKCNNIVDLCSNPRATTANNSEYCEKVKESKLNNSAETISLSNKEDSGLIPGRSDSENIFKENGHQWRSEYGRQVNSTSSNKENEDDNCVQLSSVVITRNNFPGEQCQDSNQDNSRPKPAHLSTTIESTIKLYGYSRPESTAIGPDDFSSSPNDDRKQLKLGTNEQETNIAATKTNGAELSVIKRGHFFDFEAQSSILDLARAVTSTLMLQVYHRCFGKCIGLYYPSLLVNSESDCIECSCCHLMLSPRRFVGHTHGVNEVNVYHWGFNSYNWRYYIRLSRKQAMNNLDDDELLIQFSTLQSIIEPNEHVSTNQDLYSDNYDKNNLVDYKERLKMDSDVNRHCSNISSEGEINTNKNKIDFIPRKQSHDVVTEHRSLATSVTQPNEILYHGVRNQAIGPSSLPLAPHLSLSHRISESSHSTNIGTIASSIPTSASPPLNTAPPTSIPPPSNFTEPLSLTQSSTSYHPLRHPAPALPTTGTLSKSISDYYESFEKSRSNSSCPNMTPLELLSSISNDQSLASAKTPIDHPSFTPIPSTTCVNGNAIPLASGPTARLSEIQLGKLPVGDNRELQRELFVSTNLSTYLKSKGFSLELTRDVVDNTLHLMRKSMKLF